MCPPILQPLFMALPGVIRTGITHTGTARTRPGAGFVAFGVGVAVGAAIWGGCRWGWGRNDVNININRQNNFNRNTNINGGNRVKAQGGRRRQDRLAARHQPPQGRQLRQFQRSAEVWRQRRVEPGHKQPGPGAFGYRIEPCEHWRTGREPQCCLTKNQPIERRIATLHHSEPVHQRQIAAQHLREPARQASNRSAGSNSSAFSGSRSPSTDRMSSSRGASQPGRHFRMAVREAG